MNQPSLKIGLVLPHFIEMNRFDSFIIIKPKLPQSF